MASLGWIILTIILIIVIIALLIPMIIFIAKSSSCSRALSACKGQSCPVCPGSNLSGKTFNIYGFNSTTPPTTFTTATALGLMTQGTMNSNGTIVPNTTATDVDVGILAATSTSASAQQWTIIAADTNPTPSTFYIQEATSKAYLGVGASITGSNPAGFLATLSPSTTGAFKFTIVPVSGQNNVYNFGSYVDTMATTSPIQPLYLAVANQTTTTAPISTTNSSVVFYIGPPSGVSINWLVTPTSS